MKLDNNSITNMPTSEQMYIQFVQMQQQLQQQARQIDEQKAFIKRISQETKSANKPTSPSHIPTNDIAQQERLPVLEKFKGNRSLWVEWYIGALHKLNKDGQVIGSC
ncbi:hypothetical protein EV44_g3154 [Erysiphe necator]|uniref:Uncharacterized protein n=1 Tax=Uncinula necator TaxID=52586 RepID=A0A0B1PAF1_UNCNE|nr:hypothetical protein EV44_g3154 [Erysiphe necator]